MVCEVVRQIERGEGEGSETMNRCFRCGKEIADNLWLCDDCWEMYAQAVSKAKHSRSLRREEKEAKP